MLNKMTLGDKILICSLILISIAWLGLTFLFYSNEENKMVEINIGGELVERLILSENAENIYSFNFGENTVYIEVKDGAVRMLEMNREICPDAICSNTGWIKKGYETIVCMPNDIIVTIKENNVSNQEIDIIA